VDPVGALEERAVELQQFVLERDGGERQPLDRLERGLQPFALGAGFSRGAVVPGEAREPAHAQTQRLQLVVQACEPRRHRAGRTQRALVALVAPEVGLQQQLADAVVEQLDGAHALGSVEEGVEQRTHAGSGLAPHRGRGRAGQRVPGGCCLAIRSARQPPPG
jgi:hypothetical protein